ncbi:MAG: plasmid mobilization relaxosome protein MobC [Oscillospiraceae bacterium]|nr:plasmid mobilization relaxosome protein MobC [Oscillospiraceae bacterium]
MPTRKGNKAIVIYYSPEEWETICKKATAARLRNGTYIRRMSVKGEIKYYELKELMSMKNAFLSIGNNLNQIAAVANSTGSVYQKDIEDMQEEFKYFRSVMKNYLFEISPTLIH